MRHFLIFSLLLGVLQGSAQTARFEQITYPVEQFGGAIGDPFAGGLNAPQFSAGDLNRDGVQDLVLFDRTGDVVLPFINNLTGGSQAYRYAPEYARTFPALNDWMLLRDFNQDGAADIFTASNHNNDQEIRVFRGFFDGDNVLRFDTFFFNYPASCSACVPTYIFYPDETPGQYNNFPMSRTDIPSIDDVDYDGDLDIVAFQAGSSTTAWWLRNMSVERGFGLDSLQFVLEDRCWGKFFENGLEECLALLSSTPDECAHPLWSGEFDDRNNRHPGATLTTFDEDGDGDKDILIGNVSFDCLMLLKNGGTPQQAWMNEIETPYGPDNTEIEVVSFPGAYILDVNNDDKKDLIVTPNSPTLLEDRRNVWFFENVSADESFQFEYRNKSLFVGDMIDMGTVSHPAFGDVNGDGLFDLVVGNFGYYSKPPESPQVSYYNSRLYLYLNTGTPGAPAFRLEDDNWLNFAQYTPTNYDFTPTFGDLDGDGDQDLLVGSLMGGLFAYFNQAGPGQPMMLERDLNVMWSSMDVGISSSPFIYDVDNDGLVDILMGEQNGNVNFYKNVGSPNEPSFNTDENTAPNIPVLGAIDVSAGVSSLAFSSPNIIPTNDGPLLVSGSQSGFIKAYRFAGASATAFDLVSPQFGNIYDGLRSHPAFADLDDDGQLEMVVGNQRGGLTLYHTELKAYVPPVGVDAAPSHFPVRISPNPAHNWVKIETLALPESPVRLTIWNTLGQVVDIRELTAPIQYVDVSEWTPGLFHFALQSGRDRSFVKVIIHSK